MFSDIFSLFPLLNFKTKVLTAQKNLLLECLVWGSQLKQKKEAGSKLTVKIIFQFKYWKSCAQSSGHFRWRPPLSQACGLSLRQQQNVSHYQHFDVFMYIKKLQLLSGLELQLIHTMESCVWELWYFKGIFSEDQLLPKLINQ